MRYHKYNKKGIDITDAIRDNKTVIVMMSDGSEFTPEVPEIETDIFSKIVLVIDKQNNCKLEVF